MFMFTYLLTQQPNSQLQNQHKYRKRQKQTKNNIARGNKKNIKQYETNIILIHATIEFN
jgi:hypothetical protein